MWEKRLRLWSGILVTLYVIPHLINHAVGLVSLEAMEAMRKVLAVIWQGSPGAPILLAAFLLHFFLSLFALYSRSTLRMPVWEGVQIGLGLLIFPLILVHVIGTAVAGQMVGFDPSYKYVISAIWVADPIRGVQQSLMLLIVWGHVSMGLHFWLRLKSWYRRWVPLLYAVAVLIPVMALLGFARVGRQLTVASEADPEFLAKVFAPLVDYGEMMHDLSALEPNIAYIFAVLVASVFVARVIRHFYRNRHGVYHVTIPDGRTLGAPVGQSILETLRVAGVPHASVCGGRGRCTTCRVHVGAEHAKLPMPGEIERRALTRIEAEPEVRLACQTRPRYDLSIKPLLPPNATAQDANRPGGIQGREQKVAVMFLDIRGSTKLGEDKLPYDVLFILNQFFAEMAAALAETTGHYAQFNGDGLMALYGTESPIEVGCKNAVAGAAAMAQRLDELNDRLSQELKEPLRMGIGIHCGDVIVGTMGPPTAQNFSAIGDDVNVTARLEALSKDYGCQLILSAAAADYAGLDMSPHPEHLTEVRGREEPVQIYAVQDPRSLIAEAESAA